jgi:hypothetical protein
MLATCYDHLNFVHLIIKIKLTEEYNYEAPD